MKRIEFIITSLTAISLLANCQSNRSKYHCVTFDTNGGSKVEKVIVKDNHPLTKPDNPTHIGYEHFAMWCTDEDLIEEYDFSQLVTEDFTLYAKWDDAFTYTITYHNIDPSEHPTDPTTYTYEDTITLSSPSRDNWNFEGWYEDATFKEETKITTIQKTTGNKDLYAKMVYMKTSLEECSWEEIKIVSEKGGARATFGVPGSQTKKVQLKQQDKNGDGADKITEGELYQTVRIIGYNHDKDDKDNLVGITFEFVDLLSDENGCSLASLWQDINADNCNFDYSNSSIRKNLTGNGNGVGGWYQIYEDKRSEEYNDKTVFSMLPNELQEEGIIKPVKKKVNIHNNDWVETDIVDKIFLLAPKEANYDGNFAEKQVDVYDYYKGTASEGKDAKRIKMQIGADSTSSMTEITDNAYGTGTSFAGFNCDQPRTGCYWWLRSPADDWNKSNTRAFCVDFNGSFETLDTNYFASAVAPAFCI